MKVDYRALETPYQSLSHNKKSADTKDLLSGSIDSCHHLVNVHLAIHSNRSTLRLIPLLGGGIVPVEADRQYDEEHRQACLSECTTSVTPARVGCGLGDCFWLLLPFCAQKE